MSSPGTSAAAAAIDPDEAAIVRRIFAEFAAGRSPKAIARGLNDEGVPGPRGILWRDTAIRGHRQRGTGILNNELYVGRLVWNRLRYVKDPRTGRRVSRPNPPEAWVIEEVPELRIIDVALWERGQVPPGRDRRRPGAGDQGQPLLGAPPRHTPAHRPRPLHRLRRRLRRRRARLSGLRQRPQAREVRPAQGHPPRGARGVRARPRPRSPDAARRGQGLRRRLHARDQRRPGRCGSRTRPAAEAARHRSAASSRASTMPSATACGRRGCSRKIEGWRPTRRASRLNWPRRRRRRCGCTPTWPNSTASRSSRCAESLADPLIHDEAMTILRGLIDHRGPGARPGRLADRAAGRDHRPGRARARQRAKRPALGYRAGRFVR